MVLVVVDGGLLQFIKLLLFPSVNNGVFERMFMVGWLKVDCVNDM